MKQASRFFSGCACCADQRLAPEERNVLAELDRPAEAGLERRVIGADVGAPGAVALLEPQRLDGAIAGVGDAERLAGVHQRIVDGERVLDGDVQLPAELADVGHAQRPHRRAGDVELAPGGERERRVRHIGLGHRLPGPRAPADPSAPDVA